MKRIIFRLIIIIIFSIWFFAPKIIIQTPKNYMSEIGLTMDFKDGVDENGEVTDEQAVHYVHHPRQIREKNTISKWHYPFFFGTKVDSVTIWGTCYLFDCNSKEELKKHLVESSALEKACRILHAHNAIEINRDNLYFFRIYADLTDEGTFENISMKKYSWSRPRPCEHLSFTITIPSIW